MYFFKNIDILYIYLLIYLYISKFLLYIYILIYLYISKFRIVIFVKSILVVIHIIQAYFRVQNFKFWDQLLRVQDLEFGDQGFFFFLLYLILTIRLKELMVKNKSVSKVILNNHFYSLTLYIYIYIYCSYINLQIIQVQPMQYYILIIILKNIHISFNQLYFLKN